MRLLVTGGAGFIGLNLALEAQKRGHEIEIFDSMTYASNDLSKIDLQGIQVTVGDVTKEEEISNAVSNCDAVIHLAAESHNDNSLRDPRIFISTNILGTYQVIEACRKMGKRLHHVSTDEVFGDLALESEESFTTDSKYLPSSPYSATKASSDHLVRAWIRSFGLRATISNCSNNFGRFQNDEKLIPKAISLAIRGEKIPIYGNGRNMRDWIYVDDHVDGILKCLETGKDGETYLFGARNQLSNLETVQKILEILKKPSDLIEFVPDRPGHDLRYAIEPSKAERELGWTPMGSFDEQLKKTIDWYTTS